jgi:MFS transporter, OFA family, oxalate/formate antiporter
MKYPQSTESYGWRVVGACFFIALYTSGIVFFSFTALLEPLAKEYGWSYAQISIMPSIQGLVIGITAPFVGLIIDRVGPSKLIFGGIITGGIGLMLLSRVNSLGMFYTVSILIALGMSASSSTAMLTAVVKWFRHRLALATSIVVSGFATGGLMVPVVVAMVDNFHWQTAIAIFGVGMIVLLLPLSLLMRHQPSEATFPEKDSSGSKRAAGRETALPKYDEEGMPTGRALKSRAFWHIALAMLFQFMAVNAALIHVMPYLSSIGITRASSGIMVSAITIASVIGRLGFGLFGDRVNKKRTTAITLGLTSVGMFFFAYAATGGRWSLIPFPIFFGLGWGAQVTMLGVLLSEYFGRNRFGTIYGFTFAVMQTGGIIGAPLAGWFFDIWGSYQGIWYIFAGFTLLSMIIMATTPPVNHEQAIQKLPSF